MQLKVKSFSELKSLLINNKVENKSQLLEPTQSKSEATNSRKTDKFVIEKSLDNIHWKFMYYEYSEQWAKDAVRDSQISDTENAKYRYRKI